jgi:hypothetical protein
MMIMIYNYGKRAKEKGKAIAVTGRGGPIRAVRRRGSHIF